MRTTVTIDDDLMKAAKDYSGLEETSAVLKEALKSYVGREAARRLVLMGGSDPNASAGRRRRPNCGHSTAGFVRLQNDWAAQPTSRESSKSEVLYPYFTIATANPS